MSCSKILLLLRVSVPQERVYREYIKKIKLNFRASLIINRLVTKIYKEHYLVGCDAV
jgi:hypothetical protein